MPRKKPALFAAETAPTQSAPPAGEGDQPPAFPADVRTARPASDGLPVDSEEEAVPRHDFPDSPDNFRSAPLPGDAEWPPEDDGGAPAGEGGEAAPAPPRYVCLRKCVIRGRLYKPGETAVFAEEPPAHFKAV